MRLRTWALGFMLLSVGQANATAGPESIQDIPVPPPTWSLEQNDPNPFCNATRIGWSLAQAAHVRVDILATDGTTVLRTLTDTDLQAGRYEFFWNGRDASDTQLDDATYSYHLRATGPVGQILFEATRTMTVDCKVSVQPETWSGVRELYR